MVAGGAGQDEQMIQTRETEQRRGQEMSWVAELKAISKKTASEARKKNDAGTVSATEARAAPITNCRLTTQKRFVRNRSTRGDQSGLMTQGR